MASTTMAGPSAVTEIERLGFKWHEDAQYDLTQVSVDRRVQVREVGHYARKDDVARYAVQMTSSKFPPIVMTSDNWIVDGTTRVGAALMRQAGFFPALILEVAWERATEKQRNELFALAATLNAQNGVPLTPRETREVAAKFVKLGWKTEQIGRAIGVKPSSVTQVKREIDAVTKLARVGLSSNGDLRNASLRALGTTAALGMNDVPYKELAVLAADAGLNAGEIVGAAKDAREAGSDQGAIQRLAELRTEMGTRIRERQLTGVGKPPVSRQLRQHLGFATKFAGREQELVETDPRVAEKHIEAIKTALQVLTKVLELQP